MKRSILLRAIAILLIVAMTAGLLSGCGRTGSGSDNGTATVTPANSQDPGNTDPGQASGTPTPTAVPEGYVQINFALPGTATDTEKSYTTLPAPAVVPAGTEISTLTAATRISSLFLGWSYDEEGQNLAEDTDVVDHDITLYPRFALKDGMQDGGALTYVARNDVAKDYAFELISYGLTEEEIRELLSLENASLGTEGIAFRLVLAREAEELAWIKSLGIDDATTARIWEFAQKKEKEGDSFDFFAAVTALRKDNSKDEAVTEEQALQLTLRYAKSESKKPELADITDINGNPFTIPEIDPLEGIDASKMDDMTKAVLSSMKLNLETATEAELKAYYGLDEDDSLQRFWREDLGLSVEQVQALEEALLNREIKGEHWLVYPETVWEGGYLYSLTINDTSKLRFWYDDAATDAVVVEYNITVFQEEVTNISVDPRVQYIDASKVQGVEFIGILDLETDEDGNLAPKKNAGSGVMTYSGSDKLAVGAVIAVNKGKVEDKGFTNDDVTYVKISKDLGNGQYEYVNAEIADVIFLPDFIPIADDGSLEDGVITIASKTLNFGDKVYEKYGLTKDSKLEVGDYLAFFTGAIDGKNYAEIGYGVVTDIKAANGEYIVRYDVVSKERVYGDEKLLHTKLPEIEFTLSEIEEEELEESMRQEILDSGIVNETSDFLTALLLGEDADIDSLDHAEEIRSMKIQGDDDSELSLDELRMLADGAEKVEVSDVKVTFLLDYKLQHFSGKKGVRAEAAVSFTINIKIRDAGTLEIQPVIVFEQEFLLTPEIDIKVNKVVKNLPLISSLDISAGLSAGTYSGFGVIITAKTKNNPNPSRDADFDEMVQKYAADNGGAETDPKTRAAKQSAAKYLLKAGNKLIDKAKKDEEKSNAPGGYEHSGGKDKKGEDAKQGFLSSGLGGDLPTKYSNMLSNDAQYINLLNKKICETDFPVDPMNIVHVGIKVNFVVALKINAMIGAGVTYANAKKYSYTFRAKILGGGEEYSTGSVSKQSSVKDIETPNFRADFYAFGMVGIKVGVSIEVCVGLFSTALDSVGVVASAGLYAELYGFLYCWYEWTSGKGTTSGAMGSLLFEIGIYTDISVKIQVGMGKASKSFSLYSKKTPLVQLGCKEFPIDFEIDPNSGMLSLTIKDGEDTVKVPDDLYKIKLMALNSGKIANKSMDSKNVCTKDAKEHTVYMNPTGGDDSGLQLSTSRTWKQYNEDHFVVECFDLESAKGKVKSGPSSFQYLPATNEIYICPVDPNVNEVWGKVVFTYKNNAFGFSTQKLKRTVYVHWKGTRQTARVEYIVQGSTRYDLVNRGYEWKVQGTGRVSGYDGIRCYVDVTDSLVNKYPGYQLYHLGYPDEDELRDKENELYKKVSAAKTKMRLAGNAVLLARDAKKSKSEIEKLQEEANAAAREYDTLWTMYATISGFLTDYKENNDKAIAEGKGTTWFTMRGTDTVIRIYYINTDRVSSWDIVGEDLALDKHGYTLASSEWSPDETVPSYYYGHRMHSGCHYVQAGIKAMSFLPDEARNFRKDTYTTEWYMYDYDIQYIAIWANTLRNARNEAFEALRNKDFSHLTKVTADTVVPDRYVVFIGVQSPKDFTVTWKNGDAVVTTSKVKCDAVITVPKGITATKAGYHLVGWENLDGEELTSKMTMPGKNIDMYAVFEGNEHTITWVSDDGKTETTKARVGDIIYDLIPESFARKNYQIMLRSGKEKDSAEIPYGTLLEDKDITVYIRYTLGYARMTWMEDGNVIRMDAVEVGDTPVAPTLKKRDGLDLVWMIDGKVMDANFVMTRKDVTATAYWHVHDWTGEQVSLEATCAKPGLAGYTCSLCGMVKDGVELPIDPDHHNWEEIVLRDPTCCVEGDLLRRCLWCHTEVHEPIPCNPEVHEGERVLVNVLEETCAKEGYTGDWACSGCGAILENGEAIPPHGKHTPDNIFETLQEETCSTEGLECCHCTVCGQELTNVRPKNEYKHKWGESTVIKEATCGKGIERHTCELCGVTEDVEIPAVTIYHHWELTDEVSGSCVREGIKYFTCSVCGDKHEVNYGLAEDVHEHLGDAEVITEPGCFTSGEQRRKCADCGKYATEEIEPLGCDYGDAVYEWSADNLTVSATVTCRRDPSHVHTESVSATRKIVKAPTCTEAGEILYTTNAFFDTEYFTVQTKTVTTKATGHSWGEPEYTWSADLSSVTATRVCTRDSAHVETETVKVTSKVTKEATATEKGETTYMATFTNSAFATQTKTIADIDANPDWGDVKITWASDHSSAMAERVSRTDSTVRETEVVTDVTVTKDVAATCTKDGETVYSVTFANEAFGTRTDTVVHKATGHDWNKVTYTWAEDNSTVTAKRVCKNDPKHVETETANVTSHVTKEPTVTDKGETTYTAEFTNKAFETQTKTLANIDSVDPDWSEVTVTWNKDHSSVTAERVSRADSTVKETETVTAISITVNEAATCEKDGKTVYSATFANKAFGTRTDTVVHKATGHDWGAPKYEWDGLKTVTATRVCKNNSKDVETETVTVKAEVTTQPTVRTMGVTTYTATFENSAFETQTKVLTDVQKLDPEWGKPTITWKKDGSSVTAIRYSTVDSTYYEEETVSGDDITMTETKPTCTKDGEKLYKAVFQNEAFGESEYSVKTNKLGHSMKPVEETVVEPEPIRKDGFVTGWTVGHMNTYCEHEGCTETEEDVPIYPWLAFTAELAELYSTEDGIHFKVDVEALIEAYGEDTFTVGQVARDIQGIAHYRTMDKENPGWYLPGYVKDDATEEVYFNNYHMVFGECEVVAKDNVDGNSLVKDYKETGLKVNLEYKFEEPTSSSDEDPSIYVVAAYDADKDTYTVYNLDDITLEFVWKNNGGTD